VAKKSRPAYEHLRLTDALEPGVRVILVGINPGVLSAVTGHHFAGPTNCFWGLLYGRIVPEPITHEDDVRLPEWGIGMTNLVARPSPGIDVLTPREYLDGWKILEKKIERFRPRSSRWSASRCIARSGRPWATRRRRMKPGFQHATVHGARIFVLPNEQPQRALQLRRHARGLLELAAAMSGCRVFHAIVRGRARRYP
jgi:TDG/mug DNA glycosylase family protein